MAVEQFFKRAKSKFSYNLKYAIDTLVIKRIRMELYLLPF